MQINPQYFYQQVPGQTKLPPKKTIKSKKASAPYPKRAPLPSGPRGAMAEKATKKFRRAKQINTISHELDHQRPSNRGIGIRASH
jgi:hypothetical protein